MNEPIEPEELTELLDDDLEMWAQGGTRILPKSELQRASLPPASRGPKPDSLPPVAYPSTPPPPVAAPATSSTPLLAAMIGMAAVFFLAAAGGGIFYALHRASATPTESVASQSVATTTTSEPEHVTVAPTTELVTIAAPAATTTQKVASTTVATPSPVVRYGTIQTFAVGAGKPVFLDGKQIGTGGSHIKAACGKHSVSVGSSRAKTYDIPCNGTPITVGTPDGV